VERPEFEKVQNDDRLRALADTASYRLDAAGAGASPRGGAVEVFSYRLITAREDAPQSFFWLKVMFSVEQVLSPASQSQQELCPF
jgi:hypothetical protein